MRRHASPPETDAPRSMTPGSPVMSLHGASFGYADRAVIGDVTLRIDPGEVVALLGPNGSGKSTLVKGLLGLNQHLAGQVELFGTPLGQFREHARLGYVPQRHTLSASVRATVDEIVMVGRLPHQSWLARAGREDRAIVSRALELVGLEDRAHEDVSTLSGGQQRRVLIARALAAQPDVLVMDEPTAGVDAASQEVLAQVLARLAGRGTTMLIVTHELAALHDIVSRIVMVSTGHVRFDGTPAEFARQQAVLTLGDGSHGGHHHDHDDAVDPRHPSSTPAGGPLDPEQGGAGA
ncbi:MAG TPA: metal ABC transporter ATP-binding protein [Segeticoccus sp.]|uniref:metal ABC transporter ATP-binding protein n=1 Tax=Segeticoccus sp. TaxID=2706531 RepID=UPI002D80B985|nr:metal ABC transporter ATP-binding protein [Segeticoccus sp.]HET8600484.1 metal ABC transporter ATP-binding protein [Segeticoccus sp.]